MAVMLAVAGCSAPTGPPLATEIKILETGPLRIDRIYPSMTGPSQRVAVDMSGLDWVTSLRTEVVEHRTGEPMGEEFFCHAQFQFPDGYRPMVTATGISDIRFPEGFAMPLQEMVGVFKQHFDKQGNYPEPLSFFGMLLNNHEPDLDVEARVRATIGYVRNENVGSPPRLKRLYRAPMPMTVEDLEAYTPAEETDVATHCVLVEGQNNHWLVPPGPQTTRKRYSGAKLLVDTRVHYAVVHLHNYGVYMRLTDTTTGEILWQTDAVYEPDRKQIIEIPVYSSVEGFPLYVDREYEIEAFYDNTTDHDIDAMAMMSLYHHPPVEHEFRPERTE